MRKSALERFQEKFEAMSPDDLSTGPGSSGTDSACPGCRRQAARAERAEAHNRTYLHAIKGLEGRAERAEAELDYSEQSRIKWHTEALELRLALARVRAWAENTDLFITKVHYEEFRAALEEPK